MDKTHTDLKINDQKIDTFIMQPVNQ